MLTDFNQYLFKQTPQEISTIIASIGRERLTTYLSVCGSERDALALYECNAHLSKHIYDLLGGFEVVLRNRVSSSIIDHIISGKIGIGPEIFCCCWQKSAGRILPRFASA